MRVLGIDLGASRTGLALSDPMGVICTPLGILEERDEARLIKSIAAVVQENDVAKVVMGLPRPLGGGTNQQLENVLSFKVRLERELSVPVITWDERFTSKLAERGRTRSAGRDSVAACYMLQNYLDSRVDAMGEEETDES